MKIPVLAVVGAACRDTLRFMIRHPMAMLATVACSLLLDYLLWIVGQNQQGLLEPGTLAAWLQTIAIALIWIPVFVFAVREIYLGERVPVALRGILSPSTYIYAVYTAIVLSICSMMTMLQVESWISFVLASIFTVAWFIFVPRTTLTFTSLALGRLDIGLMRSYEMTSGHTFRLLAILALLLAVTGLAATFVLIAAVVAGFDPLDMADGAGTPGASAMAAVGLVGQIIGLLTVIAGAHIYRVLCGEPQPAQNGRY